MPSLVRSVVVVLLLAGSAAFLAAETIDPNNDDSQYAWAENAGWLNAEPGGDGGPGMAIFEDRVDGWMWSENLGWISLSCINTDSCQRVDYKVDHDGAGSLSGYAWSENAGWISFSCENTVSCATVNYSVTLDTRTGELAGWAWSENVGWISFSCVNTASCATVDYGVQTNPDQLTAMIFADGFESGDTSAWSSTVP